MLAVILVVAAQLRLYNFAGWSLSNDELSALNRLRYDGFQEMITQGVKLNDFHPAGVQGFLWFWVKMFGNEVWVVRLPFVICGIFSVWFTWLIGKRWFGKTTGLFAAAAIAFLQYPILYSQLARPYAPGLLFSVAAVWYWTKIIFDRDKNCGTYAGFTVFATLSAYTHHYSFLFVMVVGATGLFFIRKSELRNYLLAALAAAVLYLPHLQIFLYQFGIGGVGGEEGWLGEPEPRWILDYLWFALNESIIVATILAVAFLFSIYWFSKKFTKFKAISILWFLLMFFIGYFYSVYRNPILQYSILIFSFPFLVLFVFSSFGSVSGRAVYILLLLFLAVGSVQTSVFNRFHDRQHFGEFEDLAQKIADWNREFGSENISNTIVVNAPFYIHYYLDEMEPGIRFLQYDNRGGNDLASLAAKIDSVETPFFAYGWTKPAPPEIDLLIREKYPCMLSRGYYNGLSEVTLYARETTDSCLKIPEPVFSYSNNYDDQATIDQWGFGLSDEHFVSPPYSIRMGSSLEYAPGFKARVSEINQGKFDRVEVEVKVFAEEDIKNAVIVMTISGEDEDKLWRGSNIQLFVQPGEWQKGFLAYQFWKSYDTDDVLNIYLWNQGKTRLYIDNFKVRFYNSP